MLSEGKPFVEVVRTARLEHVDLIVMGSYGGQTGDVERIFFGSTAEQVVRTANCSVLCVPFMPAKSSEMREQLGLPADVASLRLEEASRPGADDWHTVNKPVPLFPRLEIPADE